MLQIFVIVSHDLSELLALPSSFNPTLSQTRHQQNKHLQTATQITDHKIPELRREPSAETQATYRIGRSPQLSYGGCSATAHLPHASRRRDGRGTGGIFGERALYSAPDERHGGDDVLLSRTFIRKQTYF